MGPRLTKPGQWSKVCPGCDFLLQKRGRIMGYHGPLDRVCVCVCGWVYVCNWTQKQPCLFSSPQDWVTGLACSPPSSRPRGRGGVPLALFLLNKHKEVPTSPPWAATTSHYSQLACPGVSHPLAEESRGPHPPHTTVPTAPGL